MPCNNCIDGICQGRCLPTKEIMLDQLKPMVKEDMFTSLESKPEDFIIKVYNKAFFFTPQQSADTDKSL